jgi:hypothetical protein
VIGIFPDEASMFRLVSSTWMEISDELLIGQRYFGRESMKKVLEPEPLLAADQALSCLIPVHEEMISRLRSVVKAHMKLHHLIKQKS